MDHMLCRLCLAPSSATVALFDDATMQPNVLLLQKVVECTSIRLTAEEDYPSSVCTDCERKLNEWSTFKIQCIVNNDFYRQKQSELRRKLVSSSSGSSRPKSPEVVCLDDEDEDQDAARKVTQRRHESPAKRMKVVAEVVIDDDEDENEDNVDSRGIGTEDGLLLGDLDEESALLDDYQLVEGQEVDHYGTEQEDYPDSYQQQSATDEYRNSTAILSSILLDDDDEDPEDDEEAQGDKGRHFRQKPNEPFQCWQCARGYSSLTKLRTHEKLHSERMRCFVCGKMIVLQLVRHMRSQHPGQLFPQPVRCWHTKCANSPVLYYGVDQLLEHMDSKKRK